MTGIRRILTVCFLLTVVSTSGCYATYIIADVPGNTLKRVAARAAEDYTVIWIDDDILELRDTWVTQSIIAGGWVTFHARLHYQDSKLFCMFYVRWYELFTAYFPVYFDTWFAPAGLYMSEDQINDIMGWAGARILEKRYGIIQLPPKPPPWDLEEDFDIEN